MSDSSSADLDRRRARRSHAREHGIVAARVRPGHEVAVIDVCADGALVESGHRLFPGTVVDLHLQTNSGRASVRGRVLRCTVCRLRSSSVHYRGAIGFDRHLPWLEDGSGEDFAMPDPDRRSGGPGRGVPTPNII
jgi:hypothetical protein